VLLLPLRSLYLRSGYKLLIGKGHSSLIRSKSRSPSTKSHQDPTFPYYHDLFVRMLNCPIIMRPVARTITKQTASESCPSGIIILQWLFLTYTYLWDHSAMLERKTKGGANAWSSDTMVVVVRQAVPIQSTPRM